MQNIMVKSCCSLLLSLKRPLPTFLNVAPKKIFEENRDVWDNFGENRKRIDLFSVVYRRLKIWTLNFNAPLALREDVCAP